MTRLSGKHDTVVKTLLTEEAANDLQALATLSRTTVGNLLRQITEKYLYGRVTLAIMDDECTEIQGRRRTRTGTLE